MSNEIINIKKGYLVKESKHLKKLRKRWIVLKTDHKLYSYKPKKKKRQNPTEIFNLKLCKTVLKSNDRKTKGHEFTLIFNNNYRRIFVAKTNDIATQWIQTIKTILKTPSETFKNYVFVNHEAATDEIKINEEYKEEIEKLKYEIIDLQNEKEAYKQKLSDNDLEIKSIKSQNNALKDQLQEITIGKGIETAFIKEEDFATKKMSPFRQQTLKNMHDFVVEILSEKYEDLEDNEESEESDDDDSKNDIDKVLNEETETKSKFDLLIERVAYQFLFDSLIITYHVMMDRKYKICQIISKQLNIQNNNKQSAEEIAEKIIHPLLQQQWEEYLENEMENKFEIKVSDKEKIIHDIFNKIYQKKEYKDWDFLLQTTFKKQIKHYISKSCELCWIMILTKPNLTFYPNSFTMFVDDKNKEYFYNAKDKHDLWIGSKTKNGAKIVYFAVPAIEQKHFMNKDEKLQIIKGTVFAHNDEELIKYIMSDPQQLLDHLS